MGELVMAALRAGRVSSACEPGPDQPFQPSSPGIPTEPPSPGLGPGTPPQKHVEVATEVCFGTVCNQAAASAG